MLRGGLWRDGEDQIAFLCESLAISEADEKLQQHAAEAQSRSLAADASPNAHFRRHRHVFFIALLIANCLQQAIHRVVPRVSETDKDSLIK